MRQMSPSAFRNRISDHFEDLDCEVRCRKKRSGYALYRDDDEPLAKLCPTGTADEVKVYSWQNGQWQQMDDMPATLPLDDALDYVATELYEDVDTRRTTLTGPLASYFRRVWLHSVIGGAVGGVFVNSLAGAAVGAGVGAFCALSVVDVFRRPGLLVLFGLMLIGLPAVVPAAASGALAAALHAAFGSGSGGLLFAMMTGAVCAFLVLYSRALAWLLGLFGGIAIGIELVEIFSVNSEILRYGLTAVVAAGGAKACKTISGSLTDIYQKAGYFQSLREQAIVSLRMAKGGKS